MRVVLILLCLTIGSLAGGFLAFTQKINQPDLLPAHEITDGISVFTGGEDRISQAVDLLRMGSARRLLISGVYETTTAAAIAEELGIERPLFACCIDLGRAALNTVGNAAETAAWARENNYSSVRIVTTSYHVPRSLVEMRRHAPNLAVHAYPIDSDRIPADAWWQHPDTTVFLFREYAKYLVALFRWRFSSEL